MAFNPISIEDDGTRLGRDEGVADLAGTAVGGQGGGGLAADQLGDPSLLTSRTPLQTAVQSCLQHYYFEYVWQVNFPTEPETPLLYYPEVYKDLLSNPAAIDIMQSELDAMGDGVLQRIPLTYYPLDPHIVQETRAQALRVEDNIQTMQQEAKAAGALERLTWNAQDVNPDLDPADAKLLDSDFDRSLLLQRDLPSLTLLQRPLYTDMGLVPQEQRHAARLARIVPQELRALTQSSTLPPGSPTSPAAAATAPHGTTPHPTTPAAAEEREWRDGVQRSFRHVRALDQQFDAVIQEVVQRKLGLDPACEAHISLGRNLWRALFDGTTPAQQRAVWHALCHFSSSYGEQPHRDATRGLLAALSEQRLPGYYERWRPLVRDYADGVAQYVATLAGAVGERKSHLRFRGAELDPLHGGGFQPELAVGTLLQRHGTELGENRAPLPIYPVEVMPVYPSGYDGVAAMPELGPRLSEQGALDFLAEGAEKLRHVVLPAAVVPAAARERARAGPHVLVNHTNLLVADGPAAFVDGATVSYHTSKENTYTPLLEDVTNTTSYLMRVVQPRFAETGCDGEGGATNREGRCCVYDRVGVRADFVKAANATAPPEMRYVLVFDAAPAPAEDRHDTPPHKREREAADAEPAHEHKRARTELVTEE